MNPVREGFGRKATKDRRINHPESLAGENIKDLLQHIGQVERHAIATAEVRLLEHPGAQRDFDQ